MIPKFPAVVLQGRIELHDKKSFREYMQKLEGQQVDLTVKKWKDQRSVQQNCYYWAVVVKIISDDTGNDPETVHEFLKAKFLPKCETIIKDEKQILAGCTHDLNKDNFFADYVDPIRA